jgi:hypothetical protein
VLRKRRDGLQITAGASALTGRDGGAVAVPHGEAVERDLLGWLQALPGFDNEQVVEAMTCAEDAMFVCWRRPHPISGQASDPER